MDEATFTRSIQDLPVMYQEMLLTERKDRLDVYRSERIDLSNSNFDRIMEARANETRKLACQPSNKEVKINETIGSSDKFVCILTLLVVILIAAIVFKPSFWREEQINTNCVELHQREKHLWDCDRIVQELRVQTIATECRRLGGCNQYFVELASLSNAVAERSASSKDFKWFSNELSALETLESILDKQLKFAALMEIWAEAQILKTTVDAQSPKVAPPTIHEVVWEALRDISSH